MTITNAQLAQQVSDLLDKWSNRETEMVNWLAGTVTGGPLSDGKYPLTDVGGVVINVKCPAKLQDDVSNTVASALTYKNDAAASATAAATSATNASTSAANAATSATASASSASAANTSKLASDNNAANSLTYSNNASASATAAAGSATAAATSETNAASSATAASSSATAAASSAAAAATSETNAAASAASIDPSLLVHLSGTESITGDKSFSGTNSHSGTETFNNSIILSGARILAAQGANIASGSTVNLAAATGNSVTVTGTAGPITSLGVVQAGALFLLTTSSALTFTHNATSLISPTGRDITTRAGSQLLVESLGSGNWRIVFASPMQPGLELIEYKTASGLSTVDFTSINNSLYHSYTLIGNNIIPSTNAVQLLLRFSVAGVFDSGASSYVHHALRWTASATGVGGNATGDNAIQLISSESLGTAANQSASFDARIYDPKNGSRKEVSWNATGYFASGSLVGFSGGGRFINSTSDIDGIRLLASSGNLSGTFALYGMRRT